MVDQSKTKQTLIQKEVSLDEASEYAESIINTVREPLIILDHDLRVVTASRSFYEFFKVKPEETEGQLIYNLGNDQWDIPRLRELLETILPQKTTFDNYEVEHDFVAIGKRIMLLNARQIKRALGKERIILLAIEDITECKQTREALKESEKKYRELYDFLPIPVYEMDFEANITSANRAIYETFRGTEEDLKKGFKAWQLISPEEIEKSKKNIQALLKGKQVEGTEYTMMRLDGSVFPGIVISSVIYSDGKPVGIRGAIIDITNRKQTEKALQESEKYFKEITENSSDIIIITDKKGDIKYCSLSAERIIGYKPEELIGRNVIKFIHPDDVKRAVNDFGKAVLAKDPAIPNAFRILHKDGSERYVEGLGKNLLDNPTIAGFIMNIHDITERKLADKLLRKNEERYRTLVQNASDIVFRTDDTGHYTFVNPATLRITGYSEEELIGKHYNSLIRPDKHKEAMKVFVGQYESRVKNTYLEFPIIRKDGHEAWIGQNTQLIIDGDQVIGFQAVARDITERRRTEAALEESEKKYRLLADNVNDVIFVLDMNLRFTYVSPSVKTLMGYEQEDILTLLASEIITPTSWDLAVRTLSEIMELEKAGKREIPQSQILQLEMRRKDGSTVWTEVKASFIRDEHQRPIGIIGVGRDITERMRTEKELYQTLDNLRKSFGATVQVMVSAVEMRDPYTAGHQKRVADLARSIATEMGLNKDIIEGIRMAGSIHDIGKLSIPAEILSRPAKLTNIEFSLIKEHSQSGYEMLKDMESPWPLAQIVYQHHERMNGTGYPRNLKGNEILIEARILAVADVVEAMASHRPYRASLGIEVALEEIEKNKGIIYDADVADACLKLFREKGYQFK